MFTRVALASLSLFVAAGALATDASAATTIAVTISTSPLAYQFNGGPTNQPLNLIRGQTYVFQMSALDASHHPFFISTSTGVEPVVPFVDPGLTGNGTATVMFTVPTAATVPLFYQCSIHSFMTNTITLQSPSVPALGPVAVSVLGALALLAGFLGFRRRSARRSPHAS